MAGANTLVRNTSSPTRPIAPFDMSSSPLPPLSEVLSKRASTFQSTSHAAAFSPLHGTNQFTTAAAILAQTMDEVRAQTHDSPAVSDTIDLYTTQTAKVPKVRAKRAGVENSKIPRVANIKVARKPKAAPATEDGINMDPILNKSRKTPGKKAAPQAKADGQDLKPKAVKSRKQKVVPEMAEVVVGEDPNIALPKKSRAKKSEAPSGNGETTKAVEATLKAKPTKPRAKKVIVEDGDSATKSKPIRKPRAKKVVDVSQSRISNDQITKPSVLSTESLQAAKTTNQQMLTSTGLEEAVKRKVAWTPPATGKSQTISDTASGLVADTTLGDTSLTPASNPVIGFGDLLGSFGFVSAAVNAKSIEKPASKAEVRAAIRKRKLIELVTAPSLEDGLSPTKKPPKKKPTTITERAIAAYADLEEPADSAPLLQYFEKQVVEKTDKSGLKVPVKRRSKSPIKGSKQAPILLSPESAMKQVAKQDFVFGTSSQLAREHSPTLLRDLHEAIQASLNHPDPTFRSSSEVDSTCGASKLWTAASRGTNGQLLESQASETIGALNPAIALDDVFVDIDDLINSATLEELHPPSAQPAPQETSEDIPSSPPEVQSAIELALPVQVASAPPARKKPAKKRVTAKYDDLTMPKFELYTTSQLAKEVAAYRFKPVKSREAMITLLQSCWEAKHQAALQTKDVNLPKKSPKKTEKASALGDNTPPKPRGRPKKIISATTTPVIKAKPGRPKKIAGTSPSAKVAKATSTKKTRETKDSQEQIDDSDVPLTPSPPRRRPSKVGKPPLPLDLSVDGLEASPELTSTQQQAELFKHITRAVKSATPAKDFKNPSWHEKILLYDPIILEDLAVWLNTGNLGKAGWDGEVAPAEVKKWCESKSICCLWKENLRGGNRSRY